MNSILVENIENPMDMIIFQQNANTSSMIYSYQNACNKSRCSHLCVLSPIPPGYRCLCPIGIKLRSDNVTCAKDMQKYLIMTTRADIKRISLDTEYHLDVRVPLNEKLSNAFVLDIHLQSNTIYWSDTNENVICRASVFGKKIEKIIHYGLSGVNGLAIDNVGNKIYWTDAGRKRIEVSNLDGTYRKVLISSDLDSPRAIALNTKTGHMVWTDWGSQVRIERADMDGKQRVLIVDDNLGWPNGITFTKHGRIIWTDSKTHTIEMIDLNGTNRRIIIKDLSSPYGITIIDNYLYWTDWQTKSVNRLYLTTEYESNIEAPMLAKMEIFSKSLNNLVDIVAVNRMENYDQSMAKHLMKNICSDNACSHLCLLNSEPGYSCHCPTGVALLDDFTCKSGINLN